jgi:hypothetical protein
MRYTVKRVANGQEIHREELSNKAGSIVWPARRTQWVIMDGDAPRMIDTLGDRGPEAYSQKYVAQAQADYLNGTHVNKPG